MRSLLRHLLPGIALIAAASAALLAIDWSARNKGDASQTRKTYTHENPARIAILQPATNAVMDDTRHGFLDGLASRGYRENDNLNVKVLISEGDVPTAKLMATQIVSGGYDLAGSISTICLQAICAADREGQVPVVFAAVSSPVAADVGIKSLDTLDKPLFLTGYGTAQPVETIFREAVAANPKLKVVGVVWNPTEINSEVCTKRARAICKELGLTLLEQPIEGSKDVREAADALVAQGAEAFWTGGDATLISAYDVLQQAADKARVPIFSNISGHAALGALFDLGANYYQVGYAAGQLAADVLNGRSPASIPVHDLMPGRMGLNEKTRAAIRGTWTFTPSQHERSGYVVEQNGVVREIKAAASAAAAETASGPDQRPAATPPNGKLPWHIQIIEYVETAPSEETLGGAKEGFAQSGLVQGRDYVYNIRSAQGEIAVINTLFDNAITDNTDLYFTFSTPALQTAVRKISNRPVIFTFVTDPMAANAGESYEKHLPNITGVSTLAPTKQMVEMIKAYFPTWKRIGTLYCPAEINSVINMKIFQEEGAKVGIIVESVAANTISDIADAALALTGRNLDAVVQIPDNLSAAGFGAIARAARTRRLPLFSFQSPMVGQGAILAASMDYHQAGLDAALKAVRVMRGDNPANIPFSLPSKRVLVINLTNAREAGLTIPPALLKQADKIIP